MHMSASASKKSVQQLKAKAQYALYLLKGKPVFLYNMRLAGSL
jgi:hypothetical protein